jgi:hypothetical protein
MKRIVSALALGVVVVVATVVGGGGCSEEDSGPYPPVQMLVQCQADAGPGNPLACPDLGVDLGVEIDASATD